MALITEPNDYVAGDTLNETLLNNLKNPIYNEFNGNIDNANIKSGAAIVPSKIADTAVVSGNTVAPGVQTLTRPTTVSGDSGGPFLEMAQGGWSFDNQASNQQTVDMTGATTFALTTGKGVYVLSTSGAAATLQTITGGAEGDVIYLASSDTSNVVTIQHQAAATANTIWLRTKANVIISDAGGEIYRLRYTALFGTGKWYEI